MKYIFQTRGKQNAEMNSAFLTQMELPIEVYRSDDHAGRPVKILYTVEQAEEFRQHIVNEDAALWSSREPMESLKEDTLAHPPKLCPEEEEPELDEQWFQGADKIHPEKDHINPDHYKGYLVITFGDEFVCELQWMETQQFKPYFRANPQAFVHAVLMQADKYLSRMGKKDDETQEMLKALWYTKFAAAFMKQGMQPILIRDIPAILDEINPSVNEEILKRHMEEISAICNERGGTIAELRIDKENYEKQLGLLRRYVTATIETYSTNSLLNLGFNKDEVSELVEFTRK